MDNTVNRIFYLDKWQVAPQEGKLVCGDEIIHLEPRAMEVLVYLASRPDDVITREELERDVWRGAVVGYDAVTNTIIKLRKALQDSARDPHIIATIPKRGYQLITSVQYPEEAHQDKPADAAAATAVGKTDKSLLAKRQILFSLATILLTGLVVLWSILATSVSDTESDKLPSIVVLPFENLSKEPGHDYLADGLTEDIITDLSGLSNVVVFTNRAILAEANSQSIKQHISDNIAANYLLKGSIRVIDDTIRVNTLLINTQTGINIWAQRFDRKVKEVFDVQDELTQRIVDSLTVKLSSREKQRLAQRATNDLVAYDLFQEGQRIQMLSTREAFQQARVYYQKAIEQDPNYGRAYGAMAVTLVYDYQIGWTDSPQEALDRALVLAKKAVALDSESPQTHWALSFVYMMRKQLALAESTINHIIDSSPNYADGIALLGLIKIHQGQTDESIKLLDKSMRLNPFYSWQYLFTKGIAYYHKGSYIDAISLLEDAQQRNQNAYRVKILLIACYIRANRHDEASWLVTELEVANHNITTDFIVNTFPTIDQSLVKNLVTDLRKARLFK